MSHANDRPEIMLTGDATADALSWFVRLNAGDASLAERSQHRAWLEVREENRRAFARLSGIWADLGQMPDPRTDPPPVVALVPHRHRPALSRRMVLSGGIAAGLAGGYIGLAGLPDALMSDHYTGIAETAHITLEDGTAVALDADSALTLRFDAGARWVILRRGRAHFDVAKAPRPFVVEAAGGRITALGTRFSVHLWEDAATLVVEESAVALDLANGAHQRLDQGYRLTYRAAAMGPPEMADAQTESAWMRGKLIFEDRPLGQVLADVNRYRRGMIRVTDSRLKELRVSGMFDIANPDGILQAIENSLPLRSTHLTRYLVVLRPA